jgi:hypothetical protein
MPLHSVCYNSCSNPFRISTTSIFQSRVILLSVFKLHSRSCQEASVLQRQSTDLLQKLARCNPRKNQKATWYMIHGTWWYMVHGTWYRMHIWYTPLLGNSYLYRNSALLLPEMPLRYVIYLIEMRWQYLYVN